MVVNFDKTIDQSNINGFSWIKKKIIKKNYPYMSGGLKGPQSPPQELEVGGRRPPYLLVHIYIFSLAWWIWWIYPSTPKFANLPSFSATKNTNKMF